jgi:hypothetical protein
MRIKVILIRSGSVLFQTLLLPPIEATQGEPMKNFVLAVTLIIVALAVASCFKSLGVPKL